MAVATDGGFVVSSSHDHSIRIWEETEDQVFLEEEKEKELEEQYEDTLLTSLEEGNGDDAFKADASGEGVEDEASGVHKQTLESLKAGERLMEALDLGIAEIEGLEAYNRDMKLWQRKKLGEAPIKPQGNAVLIAVNKTPEQYIMDTLLRIRMSQLEDALMVMPFSYVLKFLKFIDTVMQNKTLLHSHLPLICKNLFFIIKFNHKELVSQKNEELKLQINRVKTELRSALKSTEDDLGFNVQGLKFVKQQWNLRHNYEFVDEYDQQEKESNSARKRVFGTVI